MSGTPGVAWRGGHLRRQRRLMLLDAVIVAALCSACLVGGVPAPTDAKAVDAPTNKTDDPIDASSSHHAPPPPPDVPSEAPPEAPSEVPPASPSSPPTEDDSSPSPTLPPSTPSPFAMWDEASAEQEVEMEAGHQPRPAHLAAASTSLLLSAPHPSDEPTDDAEDAEDREDDGEDNVDADEDSQPSFLLVLVGNSTVARLRRRDFAKYVRVNLAARLSVEYDQVTIESVVLAPPSILVNVTVATEGASTAPLRALLRMAQTNATLLELSGEEFRVSRVITSTSLLTPKEITDGSTAALKHEQLERSVFSASGAALAVLVLVTVALGAAARFRRGRCAGSKAPPVEPPLPPPPPPPPLRPRRRPLAPPKVIYTGAFALTLGAAGRGTVRMPAGGCAVHHPAMMARRVGGGPVVGDSWRRKTADGRWEDPKGLPGPVRRPCGHPPTAQRHLSPVSSWNPVNDCGFDNPNFEK
ncbi:uncharacterized protein LOC124157487 [Ischnura elegans]|uniref:uncharacterized protein LOC124157487 n=1 Tax=Ischnura elegans TaxID=197161 RepID=UPI001ED8A4E9|nr:uncharacterized protein LOC124157487 [Ischnura elegans]